MAEQSKSSKQSRRSQIIKLRTNSESESEDESEDDFFDKEKIKKKFLSAWNNVKYGFNVQYKPTFKEELPIWFLGRCYHIKNLELASDDREIQDRHKILSLDQFFEDFSSLIWLTYRKHFSQLANSNITSDGGWGCMLRTGQMLLANAILIHMLKEGWRTSQRATEKNFIYRMIVRFFNDEDSDYSPFSLHELVRIAEACGKKAGDWYGPNSVAYALGVAVNTTPHPGLETLCVYVAQDCTIYKEDVARLCKNCKNCYEPTCQDKSWRSVLILVPVRLGSEGLNPIYIPCLQTLLTLDHCVGIIGGRPKHSLYFVGFQDQKLINLDPHYLQETVDMSVEDFPVDSFHCQYPKKLDFSRMDPSCAIGFYCRYKEDFESFCRQAVDVLNPPMQKTEYPIFVFDEGSNPNRATDDLIDGTREHQTIQIETPRRRHKKHKKKKKHPKPESTTEEYVLVD